MKYKTIRVAACLLVASINLIAAFGQSVEIKNKEERVAKVKQATVRIFKNGTPAGTGFLVSKDGHIVTAFHVVYGGYVLTEDNKKILSYGDIEIQLSSGEKLPAIVVDQLRGRHALEGAEKDHCILKVAANRPLPYILIGEFASASEGADIYICGFPSGLEKPLVAFGILSTKTSISFEVLEKTTVPVMDQKDGVQVEAAYLDVTMNKGNSGGPVVLIGKNPKDDRVIGILSFQATPLTQQLVSYLKRLHTESPAANAKLIDQLLTPNRGFGSSLSYLNYFDPPKSPFKSEEFKEFVGLVATSLESASLGIGGCVAIDPARKKLGIK